jgi:alpha-D-xyloside xylohydrolase
MEQGMMQKTTFSADQSGQAVEWTGNGEYLRVEAWGADSVRVRAAKMHPVEDRNWALLSRPESKSHSHATVQIDDENSTAILRNGKIEVKAVANAWDCSCHLSFLKVTEDGTFSPLFQERPSGGSLQLKARDYQAIIGGDEKITTSFAAPDNEHLYGMGEYQNTPLNLKGSTLELAHRNSQASVPFVLSSAGYGFLWNNPAIGRVSFSRNVTQWAADSSRQLDYWVTVGDSPARIEANYANATGHAPLMPTWGMGFWQCKLRYWNQQQVLDVARGFKKRGIPLDLIVIDFFHWPHMGDYRFEKEFWPDPKAMCDELHRMGIKVMVSVWPQVALDSENYEEMRAKNLLVTADRGVDVGMMFEGPSQFYDATNPAARQYVWDKCRHNYADMGVDAFWLDEAEPEYLGYNFENYRYYAGPAQQVGNIYPREYDRGFYEGQEQIGRDGQIVNLTRCAWAGSQRYGALVWSGDVGSTFADLRSQIVCAIQMGTAGIPWFTTDMGGFHDGRIDTPEFRELFVRWMQFETFLPVMRNHGDRSKLNADGSLKEQIHAADGSRRSPSGADNEPWSMGETVEKLMRTFIGVRELLRTYTAELYRQAHEDGQPLVRGLFYEFPQDQAAADIADEFMYGPDLLVAPVTHLGDRKRDVYLPGDPSISWTDLRNGQKYAGGQTVTLDAPLSSLPVLARNGQDHGLTGKF